MAKKLDDKKLKALVSLLEDEDSEVVQHVEEEIISIGSPIIPFLESEWESSFNPVLQRKIEEIIHTLQFDHLLFRLKKWFTEGAEDLLEGAWIVATYQYPDLELSHLKKQIEQIYYDAWLEFKNDLHPYDQIKLLNNIIFGKLKFSPNSKNFHAPANSFINVVLESKKGNPISLCILYIIIAQKLGMPVSGVNLPNLFICTYKTPQQQFYINAFNKGIIFSKTDIENYIQQLHLNPEDLFFEPCNNTEIVKRILRNLVISFEKTGDHYKSDEIKQLLAIVDNL